MATFYVYDEAIDESDLVLREQVSNQVFVMLPKIVATLNNIIVGDEKQGQFLKSVYRFFFIILQITHYYLLFYRWLLKR